MLFQRKKQRGMVSAIVAAGGSSQRMGENKLLMELYGIPVLARTLLTLDGCGRLMKSSWSAREEDMGDYLALTEDYSIQKIKTIAVGGKTRQQSVFAGVRAASEDAAYYCIHDGARPLASRQVIAGVLEAAPAGRGRHCRRQGERHHQDRGARWVHPFHPRPGQPLPDTNPSGV